MKINTLNQTAGIVLVLSFLIIIPLVVGMAIYFDMSYIIQAAIAIVLLTLSVVLPIRQKHVSIDSVKALIGGFLFLASSIFDFGYSTLTRNMSLHDQSAFSVVMHRTLVSSGLWGIGIGIMTILFGARYIMGLNLPENSNLVQNKTFAVVQISFGILVLFLGIYMFIDGIQPLY